MNVRQQFTAGVQAMLPILLGVLPFATISGIAAVEAGLPAPLAMFMSLFMYAGAAQLASLQLIEDGALAPVIIITALIINLRFVMYSASLAPHFHGLANRLKAVLAFLITDQDYAVSIARFTRGEGEPLSLRERLWFYSGAAVVMWLVWQGGTLAGVVVGARVPENWSLDFAVPLTFLALVIPAIRDRAALAAAVVAAFLAAAARGLPFNLGLILAALTGIVVGMGVESRRLTRRRSEDRSS